MANTPPTYLMEGVYHPWQQVNCLADENQIAGEGIPRRIVAFPGARRFKNKWVWGKRLTSEDGTVVGHGGFKALGIHALPRELTLIAAPPLDH